MLFNRTYSIEKSKKIMYHTYHLFKRKRKTLLQTQREHIEYHLKALEAAIIENNKQRASELAKKLIGFEKHFLKKNFLEQCFDVFFALIIALFIAIIVRQMWFEPFQIPSGSMRPTFKEGDFLIVSKDDFGINIPLRTGHFYFNDKLIKRGETFIFSGKGMDIQDNKHLYFYLFPGIKQYIKRLVAKPGDIVYFYGGLIYAIDKEGNFLDHLLKEPWFKNIEHIPFISFEGKVTCENRLYSGMYSPVILSQMNEPIAKLTVTNTGKAQGEMLKLPSNLTDNKQRLQKYGNFLGMNNFAMARILTFDQAQIFHEQNNKESNYFLELTHNPNLQNLKVIRDELGRLRPTLNYETSLLALNEDRLQKIFRNLYTARFVVKDGFAARIGIDITNKNKMYLPKVGNIPNGKYEFDNGVAYRVNFGNVLTKLPSNHPLNTFDPKLTVTLYNLGIEFSKFYTPSAKYQTLRPSRYAYFNDGDLHLLGNIIFSKKDPQLASFVRKEIERKENSTKKNPYYGFVDNKAPVKKDGSIDIEKIKKFGIKIPEKMYLALGDNHAMSADSRVFGFVPEKNMRGSASVIFWPFGNRFGKVFQPSFHIFTVPRIIIWGSALIIILLSYYLIKRRRTENLKF
jgi:signal peptidase I